MITIQKYPRTPHLAGSKLQKGDEDLSQAPFEALKGKFLVVEEKVDGANAGISFDQEGKIWLQSRGHYLTGGYRERHFDLFKTWANVFAQPLWEVLQNRYILYGEWLYAKHTIFYTDLPHYFLEFDIYDTQQHIFLSTAARKKLLAPLTFLHSVKVLHQGIFNHSDALTAFVGKSHFIAENHLQILEEDCKALGLKAELVLAQTNSSTQMEGLYIKEENEKQVLGRYKFVRPDFLNTILDSQSHWQNRPIVPNRLHKGANLFG
ncbi:RNA ligase family protein [Hugenholtzia roseola]|uniref:RNA ligase family protein n=1 Tax=Hugenholtzia roseola TaxID=1002 RepID=UPI000420D97E|nr:RNA ligase family protein [Hugenholtzia roseola]